MTNEEVAEKCCYEIDEFIRSIGQWKGLKDFNIAIENIREIASCCDVLPDYLNNPRIAITEEMYEILLNSYER